MAWPSGRFKTALLGGDWTPSDQNGVQDHFLRTAGIQVDDLELAATRNLGLSTTAAGHGGAAIRRGKVIIPGEETRTNTAYGTLTTPDQVSNIVLPTDGLILVAYQAAWKETVNGAARAAIFLGANQQKAAQSGLANPFAQEAENDGAANTYMPLGTGAMGLVGSSGANAVAYTGDVTTGQAIGNYNANPAGSGGPAFLFAAAGTYTVSIQFKASSGDVVVKNRKLWVWTIAFE